MSFTAHILPLLLSPFKGVLLNPRLRASNEHRSSTFSLEGGLDGLPLRVSNEGLLRPRVARARETSSLPSFFYFIRKGFEFSPEAVVTVRRTKPFFPPCGTTAVILSLVCLNCAG